MTIHAGKLNRRITVQQRSTTQDAIGQPVATWTTLETLWASILTLGGMEAIKAGAEAAVVKASIRIRRRTDITTAMRVMHGAATYEIKAVLHDEAHHEHTDLVCEVAK